MTRFKRFTASAVSRFPAWLVVCTAALVAACGNGGLDPILGTPGAGARPTVTATTPVSSTPIVTGVATAVRVTATFSESMAAATLTPANFSLVCPAGAPVVASVSYDDSTHVATLTPARALPANTVCVATVNAAVQDSTGFAMERDVVWSFVTAPPPDLTPPTVLITSPLADATNVAINAPLSVEFSEGMNPASLSGTSFTLVNDASGTRVPGRVTYSATTRTAFFTPTAPDTLANNTAFTASITTAATDLAGNALGAAYVWRFTTAALPDTTRPTVVLTVPANGATAVASNTAVAATFSEDMNPTTLSASSFTVVNTTLGTPVAGTVTYSGTGRTALFTPTQAGALAEGSGFTATITTAATDLAGNALAAPAVWTFTTAGTAVVDIRRPTIVLTEPAANASGVPINATVSATFSEAMNPASLSGGTFTLVDNTLSRTVPGTVTYSATGRTAIFTPTSPATLSRNTSYTATISSAATDLAGNGMAVSTVWRFNTTAQSDADAPTVAMVSPTNGSTLSCGVSTVDVTFSESMDPASINTSTIRVTAADVPVMGEVTYNPGTRVATFTPSAATGFAANTAFVATVVSGSSGVRDVAGNRLAVERSWNFSTSNALCPSAINLRSAANFAAFGGSAGVTNQGINTQLGGNLGSTAVCTAITGFNDSNAIYTQTPLNVGNVNGSIACAPPAPGTATTLQVATQALADAQAAYNTLAALPAGSDPGAGQLGGRTLVPGVYTAAGGTFGITAGDLVLDARGDSSAVWVFQSAGALTVGQPALPRRVLLINGAQARNVYWQVGSAARIEDGSAMVGTIIAPAGITISTAGQTVQTLLTGRAIGLVASVTMVNTTIVAP